MQGILMILGGGVLSISIAASCCAFRDDSDGMGIFYAFLSGALLFSMLINLKFL